MKMYADIPMGNGEDLKVFVLDKTPANGEKLTYIDRETGQEKTIVLPICAWSSTPIGNSEEYCEGRVVEK